MCATLRKTRSRGRSGVPAMRLRCRRAIRSRRSFFVFIFMAFRFQLPASSFQLFRSRLARLLLQDLSRVADALLLVRVRLSERADIGRHLADELPIDTRHGDMCLLVDRDVD